MWSASGHNMHLIFVFPDAINVFLGSGRSGKKGKGGAKVSSAKREQLNPRKIVRLRPLPVIKTRGKSHSQPGEVPS